MMGEEEGRGRRKESHMKLWRKVSETAARKGKKELEACGKEKKLVNEILMQNKESLSAAYIHTGTVFKGTLE